MGYHDRKSISRLNLKSCVGWVLLACWGLGAVAWGQDQPRIMGKNGAVGFRGEAVSGLAFDESSEINQAITQLTDLSSRKREEAESVLMRQNAVTLGQVAEQMGHCQDLEQLARLRKVTIHLFLKSIMQMEGIGGGNGIMGIVLQVEKARIRFSDVSGRIRWIEKPCVTYVAAAGGRTLQDIPIWLPWGLPSAERLQEGDKILGVDNVPVTEEGGIEAFRKQIMTHVAGDVVKLRILRKGREQGLEVPLVGSENASEPVLLKRAQLVAKLLTRLEGREGVLGGETQLVLWEDKGVWGINRFPVEQRNSDWFICPIGP